MVVDCSDREEKEEKDRKTATKRVLSGRNKINKRLAA
jgi:hypothetical protein